MTCPRCNSENVNIQIITKTKIVEKRKRHGLIWWAFIGLWFVPVKWIFFTIPAMIWQAFGSRRYRLKQKNVTKCICQNCGHTWTKFGIL